MPGVPHDEEETRFTHCNAMLQAEVHESIQHEAELPFDNRTSTLLHCESACLHLPPLAHLLSALSSSPLLLVPVLSNSFFAQISAAIVAFT